MHVSVFGIGHVGAVMAACLARDGHTVLAVDSNPERRAALERGESPVVEPGLAELVAAATGSGRLRCAADAVEAVHESEISLVCVGTPSGPDGAPDLGDVLRVAAAIGEALAARPPGHVVVLRSTVPPGTTDGAFTNALETASGLRAGVDFGVAFNPEFLREGNAIEDYDRAPFDLVGCHDARAAAALRRLYGRESVPFRLTDPATAETLKYATNAYHALKVAFANEVGTFCEAVDVDPVAVMRILTGDHALNVSSAYLQPGFAFGGPCLGKDMRALVACGRERGLELPLLETVIPANDLHVERAVAKVRAAGNARVGLLGLSYKPRVADLRESQLLALAGRLIAEGFDVQIHDTDIAGAPGTPRAALPAPLRRRWCDSIAGLLAHAETIVIGKPDPAYLTALDAAAGDRAIIDLVNARRPHATPRARAAGA